MCSQSLHKDVMHSLTKIIHLRAFGLWCEGKRFWLRSEVQGMCGKVFQAAGVALPPAAWQVPAKDAHEAAAHGATSMM